MEDTEITVSVDMWQAVKWGFGAAAGAVSFFGITALVLKLWQAFAG